jgi:hypothetical protein
MLELMEGLADGEERMVVQVGLVQHGAGAQRVYRAAIMAWHRKRWPGPAALARVAWMWPRALVVVDARPWREDYDAAVQDQLAWREELQERQQAPRLAPVRSRRAATC